MKNTSKEKENKDNTNKILGQKTKNNLPNINNIVEEKNFKIFDKIIYNDNNNNNNQNDATSSIFSNLNKKFEEKENISQVNLTKKKK